VNFVSHVFPQIITAEATCLLPSRNTTVCPAARPIEAGVHLSIIEMWNVEENLASLASSATISPIGRATCLGICKCIIDSSEMK